MRATFLPAARPRLGRFRAYLAATIGVICLAVCGFAVRSDTLRSGLAAKQGMRVTRSAMLPHSQSGLRCRQVSKLVPQAGAGVSLIPKDYSGVQPSGDFVLCKFEKQEDFTVDGLWLPEQLNPQPNLAEVVSIGTGRTDEGEEIEFQVAPGDTVMYSRYGSVGVRELELERTGESFAIIKHNEIAGKVPNTDDYSVEDFQPLGNYMLVQVDEASDETLGGVLLADTVQDRPQCGKVVKIGPGTMKDGKLQPVLLQVGDHIMYNKYAGDEMTDENDINYVILKETDILSKLVMA